MTQCVSVSGIQSQLSLCIERGRRRTGEEITMLTRPAAVREHYLPWERMGKIKVYIRRWAAVFYLFLFFRVLGINYLDVTIDLSLLMITAGFRILSSNCFHTHTV